MSDVREESDVSGARDEGAEAAGEAAFPDYPLVEEAYATSPEQIKALAHPDRSHILDLVLERAATVTELATALDRPKSSVAYHVDQLVEAELLQVVRTRKVRAIEERFYGRTGRTIVVGELAKHSKAGGFLDQAVSEAGPGGQQLSTLRHARIPQARAEEFFSEVTGEVREALAVRAVYLRRLSPDAPSSTA